MSRLGKAIAQGLAGFGVVVLLYLGSQLICGASWSFPCDNSNLVYAALAAPVAAGVGAYFGWTGRTVVDWWRD